MMERNKESSSGHQIYALAKELYPICRSLTGDGVRKSLQIVKREIPNLTVLEEISGKQVFDWEIPDEWNINDAYIVTPDGKTIAEFHKHNLHVLGYSVPVDKEVELEELQEHLYSLPHMPNAIPYVTSYYEKRWGFCLSDAERKSLPKGKYKVLIDSSLKPGSMTYAEVVIPGKERDKEVFFSTYVCHPSLANNEVSGPAVMTYIAKWLTDRSADLRYTYRIVFVPETIGAINYIANNLDLLRSNVFCGFNITCVGDDRAYSYLSSRRENTLADRIVQHVLNQIDASFRRYKFLARGSDERQYCAPGVDLPLCSFMRSKYGEYPEYHTSDDNMNLISPGGLGGSYNAILKFIEVLEGNGILLSNVICEPQLGKRGLYNTLGGQSDNQKGQMITDLLAYTDGTNDLLTIAEKIGVSFSILRELTEELIVLGLVRFVNCNDQRK